MLADDVVQFNGFRFVCLQTEKLYEKIYHKVAKLF